MAGRRTGRATRYLVRLTCHVYSEVSVGTKVTELEATNRFAACAREFCAWIEGGPCRPATDEVRFVLELLVNLYSAALALPEGEAPNDEVEDTTHEEWLRLYQRCAFLPVGRYREVFNPLDDADDEPVTATIGDDLADIHRDIRRGLHRYQQSRPENAAWEWAFHFRAHWGHHATAALYALHAWWAENYFTHLAEGGEEAPKSAG